MVVRVRRFNLLRRRGRLRRVARVICTSAFHMVEKVPCLSRSTFSQGVNPLSRPGTWRRATPSSSGPSGRRGGRPCGSLVAPRGSPGPPKCEEQLFPRQCVTNVPTYPRPLRRCNHARADRAGLHLGIRITMMPFAPMRSSFWLPGPKDRSIAGTKRQEMIPRPFWRS